MGLLGECRRFSRKWRNLRAMVNLAKNGKGLVKNLNEALRGALCKVVKLTKIANLTKMANLAKMENLTKWHWLGEY